MADYEPGDYVEVQTKKGVFRGVLLPTSQFSDRNVVLLKLDNGYNVGIVPDQIRVLRKGTQKKKIKKSVPAPNPNLPTVSILGTGGTIASYVDYRTGAVHPALSAEDFAYAVPEIRNEANIRARLIFNILSEDMKPEYWIKIAHAIKEESERSEGIVIPHGTDTMTYTAAALSFMFPKLSVPVVLVGSQRSSDRPSSDAYINLLSAVRVAKSDLGEVAVVMHATSNDDVCHIHRGTRVRKMHTSRRDAFKSINSAPIGVVGEELKFTEEYVKKSDETVLVPSLDEKVSLIYYYPGMPVSVFERMLEGMHGAIIMGTGLGHVASDFVPAVKKAVKDGVIIGMASQCLYGQVNLNVYSTGRELKNAGVIPLGDMLPEVAYVKLMWLLGNYDEEEVKRLLPENLRGELASRRVLQ
ncbi:MAG: Glu-tRNA(Gln) amidotransferase subunit GatD [Euryarchaeota archaeon]|nr:Glu-tRNA(Gln) amidotransferase subunit GatD [Euryarchaeota archaeon]